MTLSLSQRYLTKLGFNGPFTATLEDLKQLLARHLATFAFGNLSSYSGLPVSPAIEDIADKLLDQQREGYCIEHSSLTCAVLNELGYQARNLLGRVYYQKVHVVTPPLSHLVTVVTLDGRDYLFDPGFGGITPTGLIAFDLPGQAQPTSLEPFRFIRVEDAGLDLQTLTGMTYMLQAFVRDEWINIYALNPRIAVATADTISSNWFTSTSPTSLFTQQLMLARVHQQQRISLLNNSLRIHGAQGSSSQPINSLSEFRHTIEQVFHINTHGLDIAAIYQRMIASIAPH